MSPRGLAWGLLGVVMALGGPAQAADPEVRFRAGGHVKAFTLGTFPYDRPLLQLGEAQQALTGFCDLDWEGADLAELASYGERIDQALSEVLDTPPTASGQGLLDARLNLELKVGDVLTVEAAHAITTFVGPSLSLGLAETGVGLTADELLPLTWTAFGDGSLRVQGRTDRLLMRFSFPQLDVTVGRQPVTFGAGLFFTPLDLVNPFTPATIDSEYKPGVDAVRVDAYAGFSTRFTAVAAYAEDIEPTEAVEVDPTDPTAGFEAACDEDAGATRIPDVIAAAYGQTTVGLTDVAGMYAYVLGDHVVGASVVTSVGPVGVRGDAAVTVPEDDGEDLFFRGVVGVDGRPTGTTSLSGELYVQTLGDVDPSALLGTLSGPRYQRGELWLGGLAYYGLSVSQEITPTFQGSLAVIGSLTEPSALLTPSLSFSPGANHDVAVGGFVGLGARPDDEVDLASLLGTGAAGDDLYGELGVRSEFGTYPGSLFVQVRSYF